MHQSCFENGNWLQVVRDLVPVFAATTSKSMRLQVSVHGYNDFGCVMVPNVTAA